MKKTSLYFLSVKLALVSLFTAGLFLASPSQIQAQTTTDYVSQPNVTFVAPSIATTRVQSKLTEINNLLGTLNAQSQEYQFISIKRDFYTIILDKLNAGKTVRESVESGITHLITGDVESQLPKLNRAQYKQEAITLLRV